MKRIGIIGSRRRDAKVDLDETRKVLMSIYEDGDILISGGCPKGGDKFCEILADELGLTKDNKKLLIHYPDKSKLDPEKMKRNPKWAYAEINFARNTLIAKDSDILICCVHCDRKGGTEDTIKKAEKMGKQIILVPFVEDIKEQIKHDFDPLALDI